METKKSDFLNYEIWILTFGGGLQRSGVYTDNVSDANKSEFRNNVRNKINILVKNKYTKSSVTSKEHISNLIEIQKWINTNHSQVLKNRNIKLGIVQKLVNLYLKYQWCLGLIKTPPHCPFDRIIISKMKLPNPPAWTKLESVDTYKMLVKKATELAGNKSIAEWELDVFSRR
ncbi:MAG: hypothetical protein Q9N67_02570 [Ghiorsea sp.]|nr:hypothetical protein [Ghiorsea sp.]